MLRLSTRMGECLRAGSAKPQGRVLTGSPHGLQQAKRDGGHLELCSALVTLLQQRAEYDGT